ncbi:MAG: PIN domain-containing protein [Chloroflexota bacterium]
MFDSSFLYALADRNDKYRATALKFALTNPDIVQIVPDIVLTEVTHLLRKHVGHHAVINFLKTFPASDAQLEPLTMNDIQRASEIMEQYGDSHFDFVDCCIMALAERLTLTQICTFDHRDFSIFKPIHCDFLELMP